MGSPHPGDPVRGRPPVYLPRLEALEQRVREIEKQINALLNITHSLQLRILDLESRAVYKQDNYVPRFEHWPGNGG